MVQGVGTLFGFLKYQKYVTFVQNNVVSQQRRSRSGDSPQKAKELNTKPVKIVHRIIALGISFTVANFMLPAMIVGISLFLGGWTARFAILLLQTVVTLDA